jgi:hypothetical protein
MVPIRNRETLAIVALLGGFLAAGVGAQEAENLVQNFDFEDDGTPWNVWVEDAANAGVEHDIDDATAFTGKASYLIDVFNAGVGKRVEWHQNPFVIEAGTTMTFALWLNSDKVRPATLLVNHRADPWTTYGREEIMIMPDEWQEHFVQADVDVDDNLIGIYIELRDTKGMVWIDRVRFFEGEYVVEEGVGEPQAVRARDKLAVAWGAVKQGR